MESAVVDGYRLLPTAGRKYTSETHTHKRGQKIIRLPVYYLNLCMIIMIPIVPKIKLILSLS